VPTAAEFDEAAARLEASADEARTVTEPVRSQFDVGVLFGGTLTSSINALVETDEASTAAGAVVLEDHAAECRRRAEVCRQYTEDLAAYDRSYRRYQNELSRWREDDAAFQADPTAGHPGRRPRAPIRPLQPAAWAEAG
jgi:hypothetical protein